MAVKKYAFRGLSIPRYHRNLKFLTGALIASEHLFQEKTSIRLLQDRRGGCYVAKALSCSLVNHGPYCLANEFIAAQLAALLKLPIPPAAILEYGGELWFGSLYLENAFPLREIIYEIPEISLLNPQHIPDFIAFDVLICNTDRGPHNLLLQPRDLKNYQLWAIDHADAFLTPAQNHDALCTDSTHLGAHARCFWFNQRITGWRDFSAILARLAHLQRVQIEDIVRQVPEDWLPCPKDREFYCDFLWQRRKKVRILLEANRQLFPQMRV